MAETLTVTPSMTPQEMRDYYLAQTRASMEAWQKAHFEFEQHPPFALEQEGPIEFRFTPELAQKIGLREQVRAFAEEAKVSTAGVRENQNVLCPWDHRYRINEYMFALLAECLSRLVKELQGERDFPHLAVDQVRTRLGAFAATIEETFDRPLEDILPFVEANPVRIVGGEVRSNTPRFVDLVSRIYAANGLYVFLTEKPGDSSCIFVWSFLTYMLGLSGGDYFTSSHGAPQKQSDKILAPDGAQYLPPQYARIVEHLEELLATIEKEGYTVKLSARNDPHLMRRLSYSRMARLYAEYLRMGPASAQALKHVHQAIDSGLRLKLDFFGGSGYKTTSAFLQELGIEQVFQGGYIRTEEDPFFHNIGFRVGQKKGSQEYEVVHDSVDASLPGVVKTAGYDRLLADAPLGQVVFNVDPDADRFVAGQVVPASEVAALDRWGILHLPLGQDRHFAIYSPNQFFLMLAENDRATAVDEGFWNEYSNFDVHTYVSALSWDEWAAFHKIPVVRVPVGFKEIAAVNRQVEESMVKHPGQPAQVTTELGETVVIGAHPKLHHAGEESGGKIGGPRQPVPNVLGQQILAMREKSSGEACVSAVVLVSRLWNQKVAYLHTYLEQIFLHNGIANPMETRGDKVHYNEAIFDPDELAKAKKAGIAERVRYNDFFQQLARQPIEAMRSQLATAMPKMAEEWKRLERVDLWSDGLQFWFAPGGKLRDLCVRPSGTDAKTKIYLDGTDKAYLERIFTESFRDFVPPAQS
ncbi:MAG: hypothetical protein AMXMBFR33_06700 [Candidatus Xenobia bacterium]